jgi:protein phosphatase
MAEPTPMRIITSGRTVTGKVRRNNEDNLWIGPVGDPAIAPGDGEIEGESAYPGFLLAVADGMGGAKAGEVASRLAVETLARSISERIRSHGATAADPVEVGKASVLEANEHILRDGERDHAREGMGTTLTVAWILGRHAELFQVGDSRAYLFRAGRLEQLTKDQSLVGKLIEDGILSEEEAERVAGRHIILQALGSEEALDVVHRRISLEKDDVLLLCTDGLSGLLRREAMEAALRRHPVLSDACNGLIESAEREGGTDNITCLLARLM